MQFSIYLILISPQSMYFNAVCYDCVSGDNTDPNDVLFAGDDEAAELGTL